jgi:hypothetical protein
VPFLDGLRFIPHPLLRPGTIMALTSREVRHRIKRQMFEKPRGSRGDATEGDFIMEGAIEVDNEAHHVRFRDHGLRRRLIVDLNEWTC